MHEALFHILFPLIRLCLDLVDCEREIKLNCDAQDRCDYRASYAVSGNDVCFNISARTTGWVAIAFSLDQFVVSIIMSY